MTSAIPITSSTATRPPTCGELLEHLVAHRELITYSGAARAIFGSRGDRAVVAELLRRVARERAGARVEQHRIGLDTLLVSVGARAPSPPHWRIPRTYTAKTWQTLFGQWSLCGHFERSGQVQMAPTPAPAQELAPATIAAGAPAPPSSVGLAIAVCSGFALLAAAAVGSGQKMFSPAVQTVQDGPVQLALSTEVHAATAEPSSPDKAAKASVANARTGGELLVGKLVAVLEFRDQTARHLQLARHLTDRVRSLLARRAPAADFTTRDNVAALAGGRNLVDLEGEGDLDTARNIGADNVVSGDLRILSGQYALTLSLHDVRSARFISGAAAYGAQPTALEDALDQAVATLLRDQMRDEASAAGRGAGE